MPTALLEALRRLAKARHYTSPDIILAAYEARYRRSKPVLYWTKDNT